MQWKLTKALERGVVLIPVMSETLCEGHQAGSYVRFLRSSARGGGGADRRCSRDGGTGRCLWNLSFYWGNFGSLYCAWMKTLDPTSSGAVATHCLSPRSPLKAMSSTHSLRWPHGAFSQEPENTAPHRVEGSGSQFPLAPPVLTGSGQAFPSYRIGGGHRGAPSAAHPGLEASAQEPESSTPGEAPTDQEGNTSKWGKQALSSQTSSNRKCGEKGIFPS